MYVEQPNNLKPATFTNAPHFLTHSERVRIKNMHKTVEKWEGKVHDKNNSTKANSVRQVDVYPIQDLGLAELIYDTVKSHNDISFRFDEIYIFSFTTSKKPELYFLDKKDTNTNKVISNLTTK